MPGLPRWAISSVSSRATRWPEIEVSGIAAFARHVVDDVEQSVAAGIVSSVSIRSFHFCGPKASLSTFFAGAQ